MSSRAQASPFLWADITPELEDSDWTFDGEPTRELTHVYHDYPARMIPQVAGRLLDTFAPHRPALLFDPYCGTGTSLVEGMVRGIDGIGTDLNPLARLIASAKTSLLNTPRLDAQLLDFDAFLKNSNSDLPSAVLNINGISRLDFWFKPLVVRKLRKLKTYLAGIKELSIRAFFEVAFSETTRESSNTRNEEFKLYRYEPARLENFDPDVFGIMWSKLKRNRAGLESFISRMRHAGRSVKVRVCDFDSVLDVPADDIKPRGVDIVVTSPPYGDSHTTVAYGQYSRLSAAWLGLHEPQKVDAKLMGGRLRQAADDFDCPNLSAALREIKARDEKRASEVASFYSDLRRSIMHVAHTVKPGGHACYVVGNRRVKGVTLPTDAAVRYFFEKHDFKHVATFKRFIPNKRMPLRNSPTNIAGAAESTMTREHIVVLRKSC